MEIVKQLPEKICCPEGRNARLITALGLMISCSLLSPLAAQPAHTYLRKGNDSYEEQQYSAAEEFYRKSLAEKNTARGSYNLGNAIYQQERFDEAVRQYESSVESLKDEAAKASAYHNLGNAYFQNGQLEESIEAFKNALRLQPDDKSTKYNLAQAQRMLKEKQEQEQQQQEQQEQKDDQQQQDQQQQGSNDPQQQQEQQQQEQQQQEQEQQQQQQSGSSENKEGKAREAQSLSEAEARRLLEIIESEEQRVMEKMKRENGNTRNPEKDW